MDADKLRRSLFAQVRRLQLENKDLKNQIELLQESLLQEYISLKTKLAEA